MKIFLFLLTLFILLSFTDLFLTFRIVGDEPKKELNPVAAQVIRHYGTRGLVYFKVCVIIVTTTVFGVIYKIKPRIASALVLFACIILGGVVGYSLMTFLPEQITMFGLV